MLKAQLKNNNNNIHKQNWNGKVCFKSPDIQSSQCQHLSGLGDPLACLLKKCKTYERGFNHITSFTGNTNH